MGLAGIERSDVLRTIDECNDRGREDFLRHYGFGDERQYLLPYEGETYDSKAILGVAHRFRNGRPLEAGEFSGGEQAVVRALTRLGFEVVSRRNPAWAWDELVLASDLVVDNEWRWLSASDPRVIQLSELLQMLPIHPVSQRDRKFRNPNGVARKTADLATHHLDYGGKPTTVERSIWR